MVKYTLPLDEGTKRIILRMLKRYPELIECLETDDLDKFFLKLYSLCSDNDLSTIVQFLYESGVDVLSYLDYIPRCAFVYGHIEEDFTVPSHIEMIDRFAFQASDITNLKFEENSQLKEIREYAFFGSHLSGDVYLPDSIETLYLGAFLSTEVKTISAPGKCIIKDYSYVKSKDRVKLVSR